MSKHYYVLNTIITSLVNNGVHTDVINEAVGKVIENEKDDTINRAVARANDRAARLVEQLQANVRYDIAARNRDHQTFVDANARIDSKNQVVESDASTVDEFQFTPIHEVTLEGHFTSESGPITEKHYTQKFPLVYNGVKHYGYDAVRVIRQHNERLDSAWPTYNGK